MIHLLTGAEKQVQLATFNLFPAGRLGASGYLEPPSWGTASPVWPLRWEYLVSGSTPTRGSGGLGTAVRLGGPLWLIVGTGQVRGAGVVPSWQEFRGIASASYFWSLAPGGGRGDRARVGTCGVCLTLVRIGSQAL